MLTVDKTLSTYKLAAGEPFLLDVQLVDANDAVLSLDGRAYVLTIYTGDRRVVDAIDGEHEADASGAFLRFARDGSFSEFLSAKVGLRIELAERYHNGRNVIATGGLTIAPSAAIVASYDNAPIGYLATRARVKIANGKAEADVSLVPFVALPTAPSVTLKALSLSTSALTSGQAATVEIMDATAGSTLFGAVPDGMVLNSAARTITGTPTTVGDYSLSLRETHPDATNSPRTTVLPLSVAAALVPPPPATEAGFWPYAARGVPGRFVNEGNSKVAAGSSYVGEYGGSHLRFTAPPWATGRFRLVYANFALLGNIVTVGSSGYAGEIPGGAGMLEQAAINGTAIPFGGAASRAVAAGEVFVSDAVDMAAYGMAAGADFFVDTFDYRAAGTLRPGGYRLYAAKGEGYGYGTTSRVGQELSGTVATVSNWGPLTILWEGKPQGTKSAVLFGDSIGMGVASVLGTDYGLQGEQGYIERAMVTAGLGFVNLTKDGATSQHSGGPPINFANGSFAGRGAVIDLLKAQAGDPATLEAWNELVTNDITASLSNSQNRVSVIMQRLSEHGIRRKQISSVMDTNSSDGWTTIAGQSDKTAARNVNDGGGVAAGMEAWFAAGADGQVAAYYNARPLFAAEGSGANANRWKPMTGGVAPTGDGLHPTYAKHVEAGDALAADAAFATFITS